MLKLSKIRRAIFFKKPLAIVLILISIFTLAPQLPVRAADSPIPLSPSMVTNESGRGNAGNLVDESNNAGYPPTSDPATNWFPGWSSSYYPASAYIDLGQNYTISRIWFRDENGTGNVTFSAGSPGNWTFLFTDTLGGYLTWTQRSVSTTTRYLRITLATPSTAQSLYDIVLYGQPAIDTTPPQRLNPSPQGVLPVDTSQATLSLTTDETAQCRFSQTANTDFSDMTDTFTNTNSTNHSTLVTGLTNGNTYNYYVRCQDLLGNANPDDFVISFSVAAIETIPPLRSNPAPSGTIKSSFDAGNYQIQLKLAGESQIAETLTFPLSETNPLPFYRNNIIKAAEFTLADQNPNGTFNNEISSILGPPGRILMMAYRITGDKRYYNALLPYFPTFNCGQVGDHLTYETYALAEFQLWSKDNQFEQQLATCAQNAFDLWISPNDQYFEKGEVSGAFYEAWEATGNPIYKSYGDQVIQSLLNSNSWYDVKNTWYSLSNQTYEDGVYTGTLTAFGLYGYNDPTYIAYAQRAQNFFVPQFYQKSTFGPTPSLSPYSMKITEDPVWGGGVNGHYSHFTAEVGIANFLLYKATGDRQWLLRATDTASWFSQSQEPNGSYFDNADNFRDNTSAEWSTMWAMWSIYRFPAEAYVEIVDKNYNTLINNAFWNEKKEYLLALATTPNGENGALKFTLPDGRTVSSVSIDQTPTASFTQNGREVIVNLTGNGLAQKVAVFYGAVSSFIDPVTFTWPQYSPATSSASKTVREALYKPAYGDGEQVELSVWPMQDGQSIEGNTRTIGLNQDAQFRLLNPEGIVVQDWQTIPVTNSWGTTTFPLTTTTNQVVISLTTDETAQCRWSQTANTDFSAMTNTFTNTNSTNHSTLVSGLANGNTYNYYVRCQDQLGNTDPDDFIISFRVYSPQADTTPPVISNISAVSIATSAQITWTTDESADSQVEYGITPSLGSQTTLDNNLLTSHQVTLNALSPQTIYYYKVKSKDETGNLTEGPVSTFTTQAAPEGPIPLSTSMVTNESGRGNAGNLVDESNNAGYPPTSDPSTYWTPGWSSSYYPASAYIDLGQNYSLSKIWFRDENGIGTVTFATGTPGNWTTLFTDGMGGYLVWRSWSGSITTRYLRVTLASTGAAQSLYDLVLYGRPQ